MDTSPEHTEIWLFLEAVYRHWGYDYRGYCPALVARRIRHRMHLEGCATISELQSNLLRSQHCFERFLEDMSVEVTDWFRDGDFFKQLTQAVFPRLATYPTLRVWVAGCASGQEVYSLAILLHQANLLGKTRIYATDVSAPALEIARCASYPVDNLAALRTAYRAGGGRGCFDDHIELHQDSFAPLARYRTPVVYARHNLAMDQVFNQFQLILCRNVLIYFGHDLQARVQGILHRSLEHLGVLGMGREEHLRHSPHLLEYERLVEGHALYRRMSQDSPLSGFGTLD